MSPTPTQISHEILPPASTSMSTPRSPGRVHRDRRVAAGVEVPVDPLLYQRPGLGDPEILGARRPGRSTAGVLGVVRPAVAEVGDLGVGDPVEVAGDVGRRPDADEQRPAVGACGVEADRGAEIVDSDPGRAGAEVELVRRQRVASCCGGARCPSNRSRRRRARTRGRRSAPVPRAGSPIRTARGRSRRSAPPSVRRWTGPAPGPLAPGRLSHPHALSGSRPTSVSPF